MLPAGKPIPLSYKFIFESQNIVNFSDGDSVLT